MLSQINITLVIVDHMVGAGILALPIRAGLVGLVPSLVLLLCVIMLAMGYTATILSAEIVKERSATFNYPSLDRKHLGYVGGSIASAATGLQLTGVLVAYLPGVTAVLHVITGVAPALLMLLHFAMASALLTLSVSSVPTSIAGLSLVKSLILGVLLGLSSIPHVWTPPVAVGHCRLHSSQYTA